MTSGSAEGADVELPPPSIAVVVPAHQAAGQIGRSIKGLLDAGFQPDEIVVVDDGSSDGTAAVAEALVPTVLRNKTAAGPAEARNRGARHTAAEIIAFCDADVVVHVGTRDRLVAHFAGDHDLAAVFGSYDDSPPAGWVLSQYRNLLHHYVHQHGRPDASTFWTGLGAVRQKDFEQAGGFDAAWQDIEDVEFGLRLKQSGRRIRLDRRLLCTHLKEWTLGSMLRADWRGRAVPWTRLLLFRNAPQDDLNLALAHKLSAMSVAVFLVCLLVGVFEVRALVGAAVAVPVFVIANRGFLAFLAARRGFWFALGAIPCHVLHYTAALAGYGQVMVTETALRLWRGAGKPS